MFGLAALGLTALVSVFTCDGNTIPPGVNGTTNGLCTYPRGCYVVNVGGPNAGQCDDCSSTSRCHLVFTPTNPGDYQSLDGTWMATAARPMPTDWQAICGLSPASGSTTAICTAAEMVCIARGPACSGYCVHKTAGNAGGDMGTVCAAGVPVPPQRRPGAADGGTQTYCPLTDDTCCPGPTPAMDGGAGDAGMVGDAGVGDLAGRD